MFISFLLLSCLYSNKDGSIVYVHPICHNTVERLWVKKTDVESINEFNFVWKGGHENGYGCEINLKSTHELIQTEKDCTNVAAELK